MNVYITDVASFMPNQPVDNDHIDDIIAPTTKISSRIKKTILDSNGINKRYYTVDPNTGRSTYTNAQLTANAIRKLNISTKAIECLCCGTASPDQLLPGHASMVQGELGGDTPYEVMTTSGICLSGMTAMKYGIAQIAAGLRKNAVASGSEISSAFFRMGAQIIPDIDKQKIAKYGAGSNFNAEFLRYMLSDGAGCALLESQPSQHNLSLQIDWIDIVSYSNELETCMYLGGIKNKDGSFKSWLSFDSLEERLATKCLHIQQDVKLLNDQIMEITVARALAEVLKRHKLNAEDVDWFLPHYSSDYFRSVVYDKLVKINFEIPYKKWFTNLSTKGNTGSASIYIILDEFFHSNRIKPGQKLLCYIPESGRFSACYILLTVVDPK